jgi:hypothetical protein
MDCISTGDFSDVQRKVERFAKRAIPQVKRKRLEIADRMDGKARQTADVTLHNANARELSDDALAAIAVGVDVDVEDQEIQEPQSDSSKLN